MLEFDYDILKEKPFNMVIIGKTGSGKTTFLKHILLKLGIGYFKLIYLITSSEVNYKANEYYKYIYPNHVLYLNNDSSNTKAILSNFLNKIKTFSYNHKIESSLVIFDDIGKETKDKLDNFTNECRHSNISNIFLVHRLEHLDTTTRDSISYHIINSPNESIEYISINKNYKNELIANISNAYNEYSNKGLYIVIYDSKTYTIVIKQEDINRINNEGKYVMYTESLIKKYIFDDLC